MFSWDVNKIGWELTNAPFHKVKGRKKVGIRLRRPKFYRCWETKPNRYEKGGVQRARR